MAGLLDGQSIINDIGRITGVTYSDEQLKILNHSGGMCILACAGSGKTTTLVNLIAKRIKTGEIHDTKKLLCTTYSKAGSKEMEERLGKILKSLGMNDKIQVKTIHASYYYVLKQFGLVASICTNSQRLTLISQACRESKIQLGDEDLQLIDSLLSFQVNNLLSDEDLFHSYVFTLENVTLEQYSSVRQLYNQKKEEAGIIDFDDMQLYMYTLMVKQKNEHVINYCRNLWQYFFVDEFQDISKIQFAILREMVTDPQKLIVIGDDDQCLVEGTLVRTHKGLTPIEEVEAGDMVISGVGNGKTQMNFINNISKKEVNEEIVVVRTRKGMEIKGTSNHIGFAKLIPNPDCHYTYLMYRRDIGFRIGITSGVRAGNNYAIRNGLDMRLMQEKADKAWVIKKSNTKEEALYWESFFAYKYGIPMYRFVDNSQGTAKTALDREAILSLHSALGTSERGYTLLKDIGMFGEYPHRVPQADGSRNKLNYSMFSSSQTDRVGVHKSELSANTSNEEYISILEKHLSTTDRKCSKTDYTYKNSRYTTCLTEDQEIKLKRVVDECAEAGLYLDVNRDAKLTANKFMFMPLGNMVEGMTVPVLNGDTIEEDEIVSVTRERYSGYVYDISVPGTKNFVANGIVVHNCIYQWRGADPSIIQNICGYYDIPNFVLSTNYRCGGEIVKHAAVGVKQNERRSEKDMIPFNQGGRIRITDYGSSNLYEMSKIAFKHIKSELGAGTQVSEIAMLSRNNNHMSLINVMLFADGIYTDSSPEMRITNTSMYKDLRDIMAISENTYNHKTVQSIMWKLCSYLGVRGAKIFADFMDSANVSFVDTLGYIVSEYWYDRVTVTKKWSGKLSIPNKAKMKLEATVGSLRWETVNSIGYLFNTLYSDSEPHEKVQSMLSMYLSATDFMYKSQDRSRTIVGYVQYLTGMLKEKGLKETQDFFRLVEQYESGTMSVPGSKITMCTMHGSKGREWKHVILFADDNVTFPSFEGINKMLEDGVDINDISNSIEENRRLHYVAMTRAKQELVVFTDSKNVSVYLVEALSLLQKGNNTSNKHIINMAYRGELPGELAEKVYKAAFMPDSKYFYDLTEGKGAGTIVRTPEPEEKNIFLSEDESFYADYEADDEDMPI